MHFDFLINVKSPSAELQFFGAWEKLHNMCVAAEMNARVDPDTCLVNIRQALEVLFAGLLLDSGRTTLPDTLSETMKECKKISGVWGNGCGIGPFFELKNQANNIVHISKEIMGNRRYEIQDKHADVDMASKMTIKLYTSLVKLFRVDRTKAPYLEAEMLPFGEYEVIRKVEKKPYEAIEGKYKYVVQKKMIAYRLMHI